MEHLFRYVLYCIVLQKECIVLYCIVERMYCIVLQKECIVMYCRKGVLYCIVERMYCIVLQKECIVLYCRKNVLYCGIDRMYCIVLRSSFLHCSLLRPEFVKQYPVPLCSGKCIVLYCIVLYCILPFRAIQPPTFFLSFYNTTSLSLSLSLSLFLDGYAGFIRQTADGALHNRELDVATGTYCIVFYWREKERCVVLQKERDTLYCIALYCGKRDVLYCIIERDVVLYCILIFGRIEYLHTVHIPNFVDELLTMVHHFKRR